MKYLSLIIISIIFSVPSHSANKKPEWYGFLTVDRHPFENCKIKSILAISEVVSVENHKGREVAQVLSNKEASLRNQLQKHGWQGILGYTITSLGGGGKFSGNIDYQSVNGVIISTAIHISGVAFKVDCK